MRFQAYIIKFYRFTTLNYANWMRAWDKKNSEANIIIKINNSTSVEKLEFIYRK